MDEDKLLKDRLRPGLLVQQAAMTGLSPPPYNSLDTGHRQHRRSHSPVKSRSGQRTIAIDLRVHELIRSEPPSAHDSRLSRGLVQRHHRRKQRFDLLYAVRFSGMSAEKFQLLPALIRAHHLLPQRYPGAWIVACACRQFEANAIGFALVDTAELGRDQRVVDRVPQIG